MFWKYSGGKLGTFLADFFPRPGPSFLGFNIAASSLVFQPGVDGAGAAGGPRGALPFGDPPAGRAPDSRLVSETLIFV